MRFTRRFVLACFFILMLACSLFVLVVPAQFGYRDFGVMVRAMLPSSSIPSSSNPDRMKRFDRAPLLADLKSAGFLIGDPVFIQIFKEESRLDVYLQSAGSEEYELFRSYHICTYSGALGPKLKEGDHQAPEGFYAVGAHQLNPTSRHHLSFNIGFPNAYDTSLGRTGTFLMVHGGCSSIGCYAMTDEKVDEIYAMVAASLGAGQSEVGVHIFPFEPTAERLAASAGDEWLSFWENLKVGHDLFAASGRPPRVGVCDGQYVFNQDAQSSACAPIAAWPDLPSS